MKLGQTTKQRASLPAYTRERAGHLFCLWNILTRFHLWSDTKSGFLCTAAHASPWLGSKPMLLRWPWHKGQQTLTPRAPGPVSHHSTMHLTLPAQPAPWHQIHGSWQFVTSLKVKDITRLFMIHLWLILVQFKNSERYHSGLFIPAFIFLISSFCLKVTAVLHIYLMACLTSCIQTCMCVWTHTNPPQWN